MLTITIDWLAMTFKELTRNGKEFLLRYASNPAVVPETPRNGYTAATRDAHGVQVMWNPDRQEMGHHAVFGGSALRDILSGDGISPITLLSEAVLSGASITRLDLAKDITETEIDLSKVYKCLAKATRSGTARKISRLESVDGGYTIYAGSRQSERFIRIYDKAAESKLSGVLWYRLEVESKGQAARAIATLLHQGQSPTRIFDALVLGMVGDYAEIELSAFRMRGETPLGLPKIERQSDREKWIDTQVIPAVMKYFIEHRESAAVRRLIDSLSFIERST